MRFSRALSTHREVKGVQPFIDRSATEVIVDALPLKSLIFGNGSFAVLSNTPGQATYDLDGIDGGADVFLVVVVDGGDPQTITFSSGDPLITDFTAVTPAEVADVINDQITGAVAADAANVVTITSSTGGPNSSVRVSGNANSELGFPETFVVGIVGVIHVVERKQFGAPQTVREIIGTEVLGTSLDTAEAFEIDLGGNSQLLVHVHVVNLDGVTAFNVNVEFESPDNPGTWIFSKEGVARNDIDPTNNRWQITDVGDYILTSRVEHNQFRKARVRFYGQAAPGPNTEIWVSWFHNGGAPLVAEQ